MVSLVACPSVCPGADLLGSGDCSATADQGSVCTRWDLRCNSIRNRSARNAFNRLSPVGLLMGTFVLFALIKKHKRRCEWSQHGGGSHTAFQFVLQGNNSINLRLPLSWGFLLSGKTWNSYRCKWHFHNATVWRVSVNKRSPVKTTQTTNPDTTLLR